MQKKATKKKSSYHHGSLRSALVEASLKLIAKEGVSALTLRKVAAMADVSHAAPYAHFADKDDLIAAIKEEGFRILRGRVEQALSGGLSKLAEAYVRFALEHTPMFQVMFRNPLPVERAAFKPGVEIFDMMVGVFARGAKAEDARQRALMGWALIHGLVSLRIDGPLMRILPEADRPARFEALVQETIAQFEKVIAV